MRKVIEYKILKSSRAENLSMSVNSHIKSGFTPYGPLADGDYYSQSMVKYGPEIPSKADAATIKHIDKLNEIMESNDKHAKYRLTTEEFSVLIKELESVISGLSYRSSHIATQDPDEAKKLDEKANVLKSIVIKATNINA